MSERSSRQEQADEQQESPLKTERGTTTIQDTVVARVVGRAAREVEGVHMGGDVSRRAGGLFTRAGGESQPETQGVSVEVGSEEAAVDLKMAIQYGNNLIDVTRAVRDRINERVGNWVGLKVTEINITIENILVPDEGERRKEDKEGSEEGSQDDFHEEFQEEPQEAQQTEELRDGSYTDATAEESTGDESTAETPDGEETDGDDTREIRAGSTPEGEKTQPLDQNTDTSDEEVHVEGEPLEEGERADLQVGQEGIEKRPDGEEESGSSEEEGTGRRGRRRGRNRD